MKTQYPNTPKCPVCEWPMHRTKGGGLQCGRIACGSRDRILLKTLDGATRLVQSLPIEVDVILIPYRSRVGFASRKYVYNGVFETIDTGEWVKVYNEVEV